MAGCRVQYGKYFQVFSYFAILEIKIYENLRNEENVRNYFIVKCLLKLNVTRVFLLTNCIELA